MKVVGVIPARYKSTRLPGKPLKDILGYPMVWWVYQSAVKASKLDELIVATDDIRIANACRNYSIPVMMTSEEHRTAAHRLQEVSESMIADFYVQINGDEPLISAETINAAVPELIPIEYEYGTNIITEISEPIQLMDISNIKVVFNQDMNAIYMSRTPIPFPSRSLNFSYYKHVGIIGYNKLMLDFHKITQPGRTEIIEGIDTLRFIDYGKQLKLILVSDCPCLSVDTEKDLELVIQRMSR